MKCAQTTDSSFAYEDLSDSGLTLNYMVIRVNLLLIYIYTQIILLKGSNPQSHVKLAKPTI